MNARGRALGIAASLATVAALTAAPAANATTFTVTSLADSGPNTLRAAMLAANDNMVRNDVIDITATGQIISLSQLAIDSAATDGTLDINGPGASQLDVHRSAAAGPFIVFGVSGGADASISDIKISGGLSPSFGGGIFNFGTLDVNRVEVSGNAAAAGSNTGGGIHTSGASSVLNVRQSAIINNTTDMGGGGGISVGGGTVLVERSTISGNTTTGLSAGGIRVSGATSTATIRSSTIANNTGNATVSVAKNLSADTNGTVTLQNTILADPHTPTPADTPPNCGIGGGATITSLGFNLADDASCSLGSSTDKPTTDPVLGALALNSGQTRTQAIAKTSPATDMGNVGLATGLFDQRGLTRPVDFGDVANEPGGDGSDIGAFEVQVPPVIQDPPVTQDPPATPAKKCKKKKKKKRSAATAAKKCKKKKKPKK